MTQAAHGAMGEEGDCCWNQGFLHPTGLLQQKQILLAGGHSNCSPCLRLLQMDCVGCEKCKMHGKLNILGIAAAMKVLFSEAAGGADAGGCWSACHRLRAETLHVQCSTCAVLLPRVLHLNKVCMYLLQCSSPNAGAQ
jgi:hypothetical protein